MFEVVLFNPEIPPNAGNVIRMCANAGANLHLVEPLGFSMDDRQLRRAGLDYHELASVRVHPDWAVCCQVLGDRSLYAFSTRGTRLHTQMDYREGDAFIFGSETAGLPDAMLESFAPERRLRVPMRPGNRSLNLSNAVAVVVYEAWRQNGFRGGA